MEYGPVAADSIESAKAEIRRRLRSARLPRGVRVWDLSERPLKRWVVNEGLLGQ
jgi:hypothetical protein